jgi:hypothetical protein
MSKYQTILKGLPALEADLSDLLRTEIKIPQQFAKIWEDINVEGVEALDNITVLMLFGPKIRLTVTEDDFSEFSAFTITDRTQRLDKRQAEVFAMLLGSNYFTESDASIKFPVYFYDSGSMMEWFFAPANLARIAYWYGSKK